MTTTKTPTAAGQSARILALAGLVLGAAAGIGGLWRVARTLLPHDSPYFTASAFYDEFAVKSLGATGGTILIALTGGIALLALAGAGLALRRPRAAGTLLALAAGAWLTLGIWFGQEAVWSTLGPIAAAAVAALLADAAGLAAEQGEVIHRHSGVVRVTHWINVACIAFLLVSGMQIFNAHPALYIGNISDFDHPVVALTAVDAPGGPLGITTVLGHDFNTTGVLGLSSDPFYGAAARGFPSWLTLPSYGDLATGRRWHFFFAWILVINGLVYLIFSLASRHLSRDLVPTGGQLLHIGRSIVDHIRGRFHDEDPRRYNVLQKLAYVGLILVLLLLVFAGLTMSPGFDAFFPGALDLLGGRQTARTIHFVCASLVVLFILVHVGMVLVSGVWNNIRSMITGRYALPTEVKHASEPLSH